MRLNKLTEYIKKSENKINLALGEFRLATVIGNGGNGIVYLGYLNENEVAIKFLVTETSGNTEKQKNIRFTAEYFNVMTTLTSQNIVKYIDFDIVKIINGDEELNIPVIIMKRYQSSLSKYKIKTAKEAKKLFNFLIDTIELIHINGIIHRDIKPENILVDYDEKFALADFGIASYNPDIFSIRAETQTKERIGNRLFSAPEQENSDIEPHPTMDIYALGQMIQWFVTGETHRGTGRISIAKNFKDLEIYDNIIDICLRNNPQERFQNISEIKKFIKKSRAKDIFEYLRFFNLICRRNFPKNEFGLIYSNEIKKIDRLLTDFMNSIDEFDNELWWHDGLRNSEFKLDKKGEGKWLFDSLEFNITEIWIFYDSSQFNDFILFHYKPFEQSEISELKGNLSIIVDGKYDISYSEFENGYAEINDEIINLSEHNVEFIDREDKEGYAFIGTRFHCIIQPDNDSHVIDYITRISNKKVDIENFTEFSRLIRGCKHEEVKVRL